MVGQQGTASGMFLALALLRLNQSRILFPYTPKKTMINVTYVSISKGDSSRFYV